MDGLETRIKKGREEAGLTQKQLAAAVGVSAMTIIRWESGEREPRAGELAAIAQATKKSLAWLVSGDDREEQMAWLLEHSDDRPDGCEPLIQQFPDEVPEKWLVEKKRKKLKDLENAIKKSDDSIQVPVLDPRLFACAGKGNGVFTEDAVVDFQAWPKQGVGRISQEERLTPFIVRVEGNSMSLSNIPDGASALVNPAEPVYSGDPALCCWGSVMDCDWGVKHVFWLQDGGVILRSKSPDYPPMAFSADDVQEERVRILGKVMWALLLPKKG